MNDVVIASSVPSPLAQNSGNVFLFAAAGVATRKATADIYECVLYDANGDEIIHLYPTENNGTACMYDTVSQSYINPSGVLTYIETDDVTKKYKKVNGAWQLQS